MYASVKTKIVIICILISPSRAFTQLRNQNIHQPEYDDKVVHLGLNFGINYSHYNILHSSKFLLFDSVQVVESNNNVGLNVAWAVNLRLGKHLAIRTHPADITYTEKAFIYSLKTPDFLKQEDSVVTKKVEGISFAIPVQLKFASDRIKNFRVYIIAGARVDYDMAANVGKKLTDEVLALKRLDFSVEGGIGFHFYLPYIVVTPEVKITNGLRNVLSKNDNLKYANIVDKINARAVTFSLTFE